MKLHLSRETRGKNHLFRISIGFCPITTSIGSEYHSSISKHEYAISLNMEGKIDFKGQSFQGTSKTISEGDIIGCGVHF